MSELAEVKVFGESLPLADTQEEIDRQTWTMDCGAGCLVNVRDDPTEHVNLASDPKYASIVSKMQGILKEMNKDRMVVLDFFSIGVVFCAIEFICLRQLICCLRQFYVVLVLAVGLGGRSSQSMRVHSTFMMQKTFQITDNKRLQCICSARSLS